MDIEKVFPLRLWLNPGTASHRRIEMEARLDDVGLSAERFAGVNCGEMASEDFVNRDSLRGLESARVTDDKRRRDASTGRLTMLRLAIKEAERRDAPAVLLMEDDASFHPNFRMLAEAVELPRDWEILYLGCTHQERPAWAGRRLVRIVSSTDSHAVAIRRSHFREMLEALSFVRKRGGTVKDVWQMIQGKANSYACFPNLIWQEASEAGPDCGREAKYTSDGRQKKFPEAVAGLLGELVGIKTRATSREHHLKMDGDGSGSIAGGIERNPVTAVPEPQLGLLFLTRGDVNHPEIWREFVAEAPDRIKVFSHPKFPENVNRGFLEGTAIKELYRTEWGGISLVRASRAMLLKALEDDSLTHFALLSESCVPIRSLPEILRRIQLDPRPQFNFFTLKEATARQRAKLENTVGIPAGCWRFTSQWWLFDRVAATFAAGQDFTPLFEKTHIPDEGYFATVLSMQGYPIQGEVLGKAVTWTHWEKDAGSPDSWISLPQERLEHMLHSGALFARKFPVDADIGKFGLHRSPGLRPMVPEY